MSRHIALYFSFHCTRIRHNAPYCFWRIALRFSFPCARVGHNAPYCCCAFANTSLPSRHRTPGKGVWNPERFQRHSVVCEQGNLVTDRLQLPVSTEAFQFLRTDNLLQHILQVDLRGVQDTNCHLLDLTEASNFQVWLPSHRHQYVLARMSGAVCHHVQLSLQAKTSCAALPINLTDPVSPAVC